MHTPNRNPYDSYAKRLLAEYGADSEIGRLIHRGDARLRLQEMDAVEDVIRRQEALAAQVTDHLAQMEALQRLDIDYLLHYGVLASVRETFRQVLIEIAEHGGMNLQQAADIARGRVAVERSVTSGFEFDGIAPN